MSPRFAPRMCQDVCCGPAPRPLPDCCSPFPWPHVHEGGMEKQSITYTAQGFYSRLILPPCDS